MKKQYRIRRVNPGFIAIDLMEDGKVVGGYLLPDHETNWKYTAKRLEKEGYSEYKKGGE